MRKKPKKKRFSLFFRKSKKGSGKIQYDSSNVGNSTVSNDAKDPNEFEYVQPIITFENSPGTKSGPRHLPRIDAPSIKQSNSSNYFTFAAFSLSTKMPSEDLLPEINENFDDASVSAQSTTHSVMSVLTEYKSDDEDDFDVIHLTIDPQERGAIALMAFFLKKSCKDTFHLWKSHSKKR